MKRKCTLKKDGQVLEFCSITEASRFLNTKRHGLNYYDGRIYKGWKIELGDRCYKEEDISGMKFGRLTAIRPKDVDEHRKYIWLCKCDCGKYAYASRSELKRGKRVSCGCARQTHGMSKTRLHVIWNSMKCRCLDPRTNGYNNYGGRGIKVCDEWQEFEPFAIWALSHGYDDSLSIDRIDVNGDYEPSNCRFATNEMQNSNKRTNHKITCDGITHTLSEWSRITGVSRTVIVKRLENGWTKHEAVNTKPMDIRKPLIAKNPVTGEVFRFESSKDAERKGHTRSAIWRCITGEQKTHHGLIWEYIS